MSVNTKLHHQLGQILRSNDHIWAFNQDTAQLSYLHPGHPQYSEFCKAYELEQTNQKNRNPQDSQNSQNSQNNLFISFHHHAKFSIPKQHQCWKQTVQQIVNDASNQNEEPNVVSNRCTWNKQEAKKMTQQNITSFFKVSPAHSVNSINSFNPFNILLLQYSDSEYRKNQTESETKTETSSEKQGKNFPDKDRILKPQNMPIPVHLAKSLLQKLVRLGHQKQESAVRVTQLMLRDPECRLGLLRRLPIILLEDACLHPLYGHLVWMMLAQGSKSFAMGDHHEQILVKIMMDIGQANVPCEFRCSDDANESTDSSYDSKMKLPQDEADKATNLCISLLMSMMIRADYGGMVGDVNLLNLFFRTWFQRFTRLNGHKINPSLVNLSQSVIQQFPEVHRKCPSMNVPECFRQWLNEYNSLNSGVATALQRENPQITWSEEDELLTAIDFHTNRQMIDNLYDRWIAPWISLNQSTDESTTKPIETDESTECEDYSTRKSVKSSPRSDAIKSTLKHLIWTRRSCVIKRKCICLDQRHDDQMQANNAKGQDPLWWTNLTESKSAGDLSKIDRYCRNSWDFAKRLNMMQ